MTRAVPLFAPAIGLALALSGCARDDGPYPSLAPRAVEKAGFAEPEARARPAAQPDPALDARLAVLDGQRATIAAGFARDAVVAERAATAARGRAVGTEAWLAAQTALATLDDWRAQASSLVTDVEALATERAASLTPAYPALDDLATRAQAEADRETATINRLQAGLPSA